MVVTITPGRGSRSAASRESNPPHDSGTSALTAGARSSWPANAAVRIAANTCRMRNGSPMTSGVPGPPSTRGHIDRRSTRVTTRIPYDGHRFRSILRQILYPFQATDPANAPYVRTLGATGHASEHPDARGAAEGFGSASASGDRRAMCPSSSPSQASARDTASRRPTAPLRPLADPEAGERPGHRARPPGITGHDHHQRPACGAPSGITTGVDHRCILHGLGRPNSGRKQLMDGAGPLASPRLERTRHPEPGHPP